MRAIQLLQKNFKENDQAFLTGLYRELFSRDPDHEGALYHLDNLRKTENRIEVFREMVRSKEFGLLMSLAKIIQVLQHIVLKGEFDFVKHLHLNVFGKLPSLAQIQIETDNIRKHSVSKVDFIQSMLVSEEALTKLNKTNDSNVSDTTVLGRLQSILKLDRIACINELNRELFHRPFSQSEGDIPNDQLRNIDFYKSFISSPEFINQLTNLSSLNCLQLLQRIIYLSDDEFIFDAYRECLGREPDPWGFNYFSQHLKNGVNKIDIVREILCSEEAKELLCPENKSKKSPLQNMPLNYKQLGLRKDMEVLLKKYNLPFKTNIIYKSGGLGDFIQMTPVAKALKMKYPDYPVIAAVGGAYGSYLSIFDDHPYIDAKLECRDYGLYDSEVVKSLEGLTENLFDLRYVSRSYGKQANVEFSLKNSWYYENYPFSGCRVADFNMHVCDIMLHSLGLEPYANCNDVCITHEEVPENIPGDYVIVCNNSGSVAGQLKEWVTEEWQELIKWLNSKGITPVQLGAKSDILIHSGVMDLSGRTTLRQAAGYLKKSKGYIGIEGGLFHLAKAVGTPAVVIFASTTTCCFAYPDTHVVTKGICQPCWWTGTWIDGKCIQGCQNCLNLPDWKHVSKKVSKMLKKRREK